MSWKHHNSWHYDDNNPGIELEEVSPYSERARSVYSRNKSNPRVEHGYLNLSGAINMMDGMEYHYQNIVSFTNDIYSEADQAQFSNSIERNRDVIRKSKHEIIAYINRAGQFYHFVDSKFVKSIFPDSVGAIPLIKKLKNFRDKYTAHRSIDKPRTDDNGRELYHEVVFGSSACVFSKERNIIVQISTKDGWFGFDIIKEHEKVGKEAYQLIKALVSN